MILLAGHNYRGLFARPEPRTVASCIMSRSHTLTHGPAGDVRAWDMRTGSLVWTFHSVPQKGERFNETWAGESWKNRSGVNVWGWYMTLDEQRGILYMPFGSPAGNYWGGDRPGNNLFGNSVVAVDVVPIRGGTTTRTRGEVTKRTPRASPTEPIATSAAFT